MKLACIQSVRCQTNNNFIDVRTKARKTYSKKKVTNVVSDVDRKSHISKMKPVTQSDQSQGDYMMRNELFEIFPPCFQPKHQHDCLLSPVARLQQIVGLEKPFMTPVWKGLVHSVGIEIPDRCATHNIQAQWTGKSEVYSGVHLFHEAESFGAGFDTTRQSPGLNHSLHEEFSRKGKYDDIESDESEVSGAFAVVLGHVGIIAGKTRDEKVVFG